MKKTIAFSMAMIAIMVIATMLFANDLGPSKADNIKSIHAMPSVPVDILINQPKIHDPRAILQGGDTFASATVIPWIPFSSYGTTAGYTNNYDETCPYGGSTARDVVYKYVATYSTYLDISLCADTDYDSKLYVYEAPDTMDFIACNDDACTSPSYPHAYVSDLISVPIIEGRTYYIVIDGYGSSYGNYTLDMSDCLPCWPECPPGGIDEGEPAYGPGYVDNYNGGCSSDPPVFQTANCGDTICGYTGVYEFSPGNLYVDADWYELNVTQDCQLTFEGVPLFPLALYIIDAGNGDCQSYNIVDYGYYNGCNCEPIYLNYSASPGLYWLCVRPSYADTMPHYPAPYVVSIGGDCCVEPCSFCDVEMIPDTYPISVPPGGNFGLTGIVRNPDVIFHQPDVWVGVVYQNNFYQLSSYPEIYLSPGQSISAHFSQNVPLWAPLGEYAYRAYCGDYTALFKCDSVSFNFSINGAAFTGGKEDWTLEGDWNMMEVSSEFSLGNAYPNPFNAATTISFNLREKAAIRLEIFNLLGEKVIILTDGAFDAGSHNITWDASSYSSGIYFCKLSPAASKTLRMVLLK